MQGIFKKKVYMVKGVEKRGRDKRKWEGGLILYLLLCGKQGDACLHSSDSLKVAEVAQREVSIGQVETTFATSVFSG